MHRETTPFQTAIQWMLVLFILTVIFGLFAFAWKPEHQHETQSSCASNEKQIAMAMLSYAEDYDDRLPPTETWGKDAGGARKLIEWAPRFSTSEATVGQADPGLLGRRVRNTLIFACPAVRQRTALVEYMYSDLAAGRRIADFAGSSHTVLLMDGEDKLHNFGHTTSEDVVTRHRGGANYALADGHVKWYKPEFVFFPPRESASASYRDVKIGVPIGPDPGGGMRWQGREYKATSHIR